MFGFIKKRILRSIIKDITKELPKYKDIALIYIEQHKEEVLKRVQEAILEVVKKEIEKALKK